MVVNVYLKKSVMVKTNSVTTTGINLSSPFLSIDHNGQWLVGVILQDQAHCVSIHPRPVEQLTLSPLGSLLTSLTFTTPTVAYLGRAHT